MSSGFCAAGTDDWDASQPDEDAYIDEGQVDIVANNTALDRMLANFRQGARIVYATAATITVESGEVMLSNSGGTIRVMTQNPSDTTVPWTSIDSGNEDPATTYYVYAASTSDATNTFSIIISESATSPSGYDYFKKLGSFYNDASSNITRISNDGFFANMGEAESKSNGVTYQALTDGDVYGYNSNTSILTLVSDGSSSPTTIRGYNTANPSGGSQVSWSVKEGDYYKFTNSEVIYFVPDNN